MSFSNVLRRGRPDDVAIAAMLVASLLFTASFFVISISCDYRRPITFPDNTTTYTGDSANLCFGGPDFRTIFFTARTSVYTMRAKTPGQPHPWYRLRAK